MTFAELRDAVESSLDAGREAGGATSQALAIGGLKSEGLCRAASSRLRSSWASPNIGDSGRLTNEPVLGFYLALSASARTGRTPNGSERLPNSTNVAGPTLVSW